MKKDWKDCLNNKVGFKVTTGPRPVGFSNTVSLNSAMLVAFHHQMLVSLNVSGSLITASAVLQGFAIPKDKQSKVAKFSYEGKAAELRHGSVVIAAITSCTNTSNPSVMIGAGLVAKKGTELGLEVSSSFKIKIFI